MPLDSRVGEFCISCKAHRVFPATVNDAEEPGYVCTSCGSVYSEDY